MFLLILLATILSGTIPTILVIIGVFVNASRTKKVQEEIRALHNEIINIERYRSLKRRSDC